MSLNSSQIEAFVAVAQTRNFTKAAERLFVTQSALSQRIMNLESELETALFIRDRAGVQLTEAGQELLRYSQVRGQLEADFLARLKTTSNDELRGVLRIAGFSSVMRSVILPSLKELIEDNPHLQIQTFTRELSELPDLLRRGAADFIVLDRKLGREDLDEVELGTEVNVLVEKRGYQGSDIYLDHDEDDQTTPTYLKLAKIKSSSVRRRYLDDVYGIIDGARLGWGRAIAPLHIAREFSDLKIVRPELSLRVPVVLHYYRQPYFTRLQKAVIETLASQAANYLPETPGRRL